MILEQEVLKLINFPILSINILGIIEMWYN